MQRRIVLACVCLNIINITRSILWDACTGARKLRFLLQYVLLLVGLVSPYAVLSREVEPVGVQRVAFARMELKSTASR